MHTPQQEPFLIRPRVFKRRAQQGVSFLLESQRGYRFPFHLPRVVIPSSVSPPGSAAINLFQ